MQSNVVMGMRIETVGMLCTKTVGTTKVTTVGETFFIGVGNTDQIDVGERLELIVGIVIITLTKAQSRSRGEIRAHRIRSIHYCRQADQPHPQGA